MKPVISLKNLYKNYGSKQVLKGIDINIYPGQVIGYIGPNGAGKSTTVKILCGLITDYDGQVYVKDMNLRDHLVEVKSNIGYVPELAELYDVLTPVEFLSMMAELYNMNKDIAMELFVN